MSDRAWTPPTPTLSDVVDQVASEECARGEARGLAEGERRWRDRIALLEARAALARDVLDGKLDHLIRARIER